MILQASLDRLPPFPFRTRPFLEEEMRDRDNDRRSTNESCRIFSLQQRDLLRNCMPLHDRGRFSGTIRVKRHRQANVGFTTSINRRACPPSVYLPPVRADTFLETSENYGGSEIESGSPSISAARFHWEKLIRLLDVPATPAPLSRERENFPP